MGKYFGVFVMEITEERVREIIKEEKARDIKEIWEALAEGFYRKGLAIDSKDQQP